MRLLRALALAVLCASPGFAQATIEGRVTLPAALTAPVVNQRYEIVSKSGVVATNPPLAVVYLAGTFPPAATPPRSRAVTALSRASALARLASRASVTTARSAALAASTAARCASSAASTPTRPDDAPSSASSLSEEAGASRGRVRGGELREASLVEAGMRGG